MCGVEGVAPLLTSFHCLFFFLNLGNWSWLHWWRVTDLGFHFFLWTLIGTGCTKHPITNTFSGVQLFPGLYGPKGFQLAGFRFHLHNQIEGKHFSFPELLFCGSMLNWNNSLFSLSLAVTARPLSSISRLARDEKILNHFALLPVQLPTWNIFFIPFWGLIHLALTKFRFWCLALSANVMVLDLHSLSFSLNPFKVLSGKLASNTVFSPIFWSNWFVLKPQSFSTFQFYFEL